jgi:hypothetical protein
MVSLTPAAKAMPDRRSRTDSIASHAQAARVRMGENTGIVALNIETDRNQAETDVVQHRQWPEGVDFLESLRKKAS